MRLQGAQWHLFRESRRVVAKIRDLERRKKAERVWTREIVGQPAVILCVTEFRRYIECAFDDVDDVRLEQLKSSLLFHVDQLLIAMHGRREGRPGRRNLDDIYVTGVLGAFANLREQLYRSRVRLADCTACWSDMMNVAIRIWGDRI